MDKYENMDTSDEKISKYREILKQAHQKGILDNEGKELYIVFTTPHLELEKMYPEAKAQLIYNTATYLNNLLTAVDPGDVSVNDLMKQQIDIEHSKLPVRAKNFLISLKIVTRGDVLALSVSQQGQQRYLGATAIGGKTLDDIKQFVKENTGQELTIEEK